MSHDVDIRNASVRLIDPGSESGVFPMQRDPDPDIKLDADLSSGQSPPSGEFAPAWFIPSEDEDPPVVKQSQPTLREQPMPGPSVDAGFDVVGPADPAAMVGASVAVVGWILLTSRPTS